MPFRSTDRTPAGMVTTGRFHDDPFHRSTRVEIPGPPTVRGELASAPRQSVASTHEIIGLPVVIGPSSAGRAEIAGRTPKIVARTPDAGPARAAAGTATPTATPPSTAASATSPETAILRMCLLRN